MKERSTDLSRRKEILAVLMKYGIKEGMTTSDLPLRFRLALEELGPTFIKIGQILSTRPDLLPSAYIEELKKLQDNAIPEPFSSIQQLLEEEFPQGINQVFTTFEKAPLACASLSEVHRATLKDGTFVVVKIQRPKIRDKMERDIELLKRVFRLIKWTPLDTPFDPVEILDEIWISTRKELDFLQEAENLKRFYEYHKDSKKVTCPKVWEEYSSSKILVMEQIEGIKIGDTLALKEQGYDVEKIGEDFIQDYLKQIFEDGFFHADPHPGNVLIHDGTIVYLDFGMMGELSSDLQSRFNQFLYAVSIKDVHAMMISITKIGIIRGKLNKNQLYQDVEDMYDTYIDQSLANIQIPALMEEVMNICKKNNIRIPRNLTMLLRGLITIEGTLGQLAPTINTMDIIVPYVKKQMIKNHNIKEDFVQMAEDFYSVSKNSFKLPLRFLELLDQLLSGNFKVKMDHIYLEKAIQELSKMVNRLVFGIMIAAFLIGSSIVMNAELITIGFIGYITAGILGLWLMISILRSGKL